MVNVSLLPVKWKTVYSTHLHCLVSDSREMERQGFACLITSHSVLDNCWLLGDNYSILSKLPFYIIFMFKTEVSLISYLLPNDYVLNEVGLAIRMNEDV